MKKLITITLALLSTNTFASQLDCHTEDGGGKNAPILCEVIESKSDELRSTLLCQTHQGPKEVFAAKGRAQLSYLDDEYAQATQKHYDSFDLSGLIFTGTKGTGAHAYDSYDVLLCNEVKN